MSWQINRAGNASVVVLDGEISIQQAADFHAAVLTLAGEGATVRLDAGTVHSVHSSIMQILYALSQAAPEFGIADASDEFRAAETRVGLAFARCPVAANPTHSSGRAEVPHV